MEQGWDGGYPSRTCLVVIPNPFKKKYFLKYESGEIIFNFTIVDKKLIRKLFFKKIILF